MPTSSSTKSSLNYANTSRFKFTILILAIQKFRPLICKNLFAVFATRVRRHSQRQTVLYGDRFETLTKFVQI